MIEDVIEDFEAQMRDAVNEEHEGKRKNEGNWKIHRAQLELDRRAPSRPDALTRATLAFARSPGLHWEKNRFIFDLMYNRKVMSKKLYDFLVREKIADGALISKWRKPGYEILCSLLAIQKSGHNFGGTSHCRVPMKNRTPQQKISPDVQTGCICCCSGDGKFGGPVWWNTKCDDDDEEANRAVWGQEGGTDDDDGHENGGGDASKKRQRDEGADEELDPEVAARLAKLRD